MNGLTDADQKLLDVPSAHRVLRAAVVAFKALAVLYFVLGAGAAILATSKSSDKYDRYRLDSQTSRDDYVVTPVDPPSIGSLLIALTRDTAIAFFIFVAGDVIKLQLATRAGLEDARLRVNELSLLVSRSKVRPSAPVTSERVEKQGQTPVE